MVNKPLLKSEWRIPLSKRKELTQLLEDGGFFINDTGHIEVKNPLRDHPTNERLLCCPLPVGFVYVSPNQEVVATLVYENEKFPEDYHFKLREIYEALEQV